MHLTCRMGRASETECHSTVVLTMTAEVYVGRPLSMKLLALYILSFCAVSYRQPTPAFINYRLLSAKCVGEYVRVRPSCDAMTCYKNSSVHNATATMSQQLIHVVPTVRLKQLNATYPTSNATYPNPNGIKSFKYCFDHCTVWYVSVLGKRTSYCHSHSDFMVSTNR